MITLPWIAADLSGPALAYVDRGIIAATQTSYTFPAFPIGADVAKTLIVAVEANPWGGVTIGGLTVGGAAAALDVSRLHDMANRTFVGLYRIDLAGGTAADIAFALSGNCGYCGIATLALTGLSSSAPADTASAVMSGTSFALDCDVTPGAIAIGLAAARGDGAVRSWVWTGLANELFDEYAAPTNNAHALAWEQMAAAESPRTIAAAASGAITNGAAVAAVYR